MIFAGFTTLHGSWLNQAEIEISVFERGCLSRPVPDTATLLRRVRALEDERNARHATIDWQFSNKQARVKLKKLYPVIKAWLSRVTGARSPRWSLPARRGARGSDEGG